MANLNTTITTTAGFPNAVAIYYDRKLLTRLEKEMHFDEFGEKRQLPKGEGNQIKFTRYNNFAAVTTPLTEGTVPDGETLASTQVGVLPVQYGNYVTLSDQLITESIDPVIKGALEVLGYQAALSLDTIIRNQLAGNFTNQFAGGAVSEVTTSAVMTASEVRKAVFKLRRNSVRTFNNDYAAIIHPAQSFDLQSDTAVGSWLDLNKYTTTGPLYKGEIGKIYGCRFVESQNIQVDTGAGMGGVDIYRAWMFGKEAYGIVDLAGHNLKTYMKQLGSSGVFDPLDQLSTVGYKFSYVTAVLDSFRAIEIYTATAAS